MKTDNSVLTMRKQNPWKTVCAPKEVPAAAWLRGGERVDAAAQMCISGDSRPAELGGDLSF